MSKKLSSTVEDDVEAYEIVATLWPQLIQQIENEEIGALVAFRKENSLLYHMEQFSTMTLFVEREVEVWDPITDARLHGITVTYGDRGLKETFERFPTDREIMSRLGVRSDYGKRVIIRTFGMSVNKFMELWKDADETIKALDKFKERELTRLERLHNSAQHRTGEVALDMIATLKEQVEEKKREQWQWQNSMLDKIWCTMFPTGERPKSDWEALRDKAGGR